MQLPTLQNLLITAATLQQSGNLTAAIEHCQQALAIVPENSDSLYFLGVLNAQNKAYTAAEHYFIRAIKADPQRAEFYGNYANALLEQGRLNDAIMQGKQSIALNPQHPQSHNILGNAYLLQGDYALATEHFRITLKHAPQYAAAYNKLGVALQKQQQYAEAIRCFQYALTLPDHDLETYYNLGQTLQESGQITAAYHCYQQLLKRNPNHLLAQQNLKVVDPSWLEPLQGKHIVLRRFQASDSAFLTASYANDSFMQFYHHFLPRHQPLRLLEQKLQQNALLHPCQTKAIDWVIFKIDHTQQEKPIGMTNLVDIQFAHRRAELLVGIPNAADRTSHAGLEASLLVMDFAFNRVKFNKLSSYVYANNPVAQKNTLALGFKQEGYLHAHIVQPDNGLLVDLYINGLTVHDYHQNSRLAKLSQRFDFSLSL